MTLAVNICAYDSVECHGGPHVWVTRIASALKKLNVDVRVTLLSWDIPEQGFAYTALQQQGVEVATKRLTETSEDVRWLLQQVEHSAPDVFVVNNVIPAYYTTRYLKESKIATVGVIRSDVEFYDRITQRFAVAPGVDQVSGLVFVSSFLKGRFSATRPEFPACVIPSGTTLPEEPNLAANGPLEIAYVGRLVEEAKQITKLAHAFVNLVKRVPNIRVTLYGDGDRRASIEQIIVASECRHVRLAGHLPDTELRGELLKTHVLVLLSDFEGSPMAVMDGMACGCVPVCLDIRSGIPDLVQHEVTGLIVKDRDEDFFAAIQRLEEDRVTLRRLSINAQEFSAKYLSIKACSQKYLEFFESIGATTTKPKFRTPNTVELPSFDPIFASEDTRGSSRPLQQEWQDTIRQKLGKLYRRFRNPRSGATGSDRAEA